MSVNAMLSTPASPFGFCSEYCRTGYPALSCGYPDPGGLEQIVLSSVYVLQGL
uniref:Uncharacterized protein n=1 Tax=Faecalibaculum rodentium TaxID=1702221 RepID=A0A140DT82_9FIRM|nr:hypothetical protein AALO17_07250 [Faecalibaculum rodentium]